MTTPAIVFAKPPQACSALSLLHPLLHTKSDITLLVVFVGSEGMEQVLKAIIVVSIFISIIQIQPQYTIVVSILFSLIIQATIFLQFIQAAYEVLNQK